MVEPAIRAWLLLGSNHQPEAGFALALGWMRRQGRILQLGECFESPAEPPIAGLAPYRNQALSLLLQCGPDQLRRDLKALECQAGPRHPGRVPLDIDLVLLRSGDGRLWADPDKYAPAYARRAFAGLLDDEQHRLLAGLR